MVKLINILINQIMWAPDLGYPSGKQHHIIRMKMEGKKHATNGINERTRALNQHLLNTISTTSDMDVSIY